MSLYASVQHQNYTNITRQATVQTALQPSCKRFLSVLLTSPFQGSLKPFWSKAFLMPTSRTDLSLLSLIK